MTQISRRRLDADTQKRIYEIFVEVITDAQKQSEVESLLEDFFTPTERVMLPKRLCIAYLLIKNYQHRTISSYLKVSFTTINRVSNSLKTSGRGYTLLLTRLQKHEQYKRILKKIEEGIVNALASVNGPSTVWKQVQRQQRKAKFENQKPF